jgi:hypothetical protein
VGEPGTRGTQVRRCGREQGFHDRLFEGLTVQEQTTIIRHVEPFVATGRDTVGQFESIGQRRVLRGATSIDPKGTVNVEVSVVLMTDLCDPPRVPGKDTLDRLGER